MYVAIGQAEPRPRLGVPDPDSRMPVDRADLDTAIRAFGAPLGPRIALLHSHEFAVACPTLVISGTHDIGPVATMQVLASLLPNGRHHEIAAGHFMPAQAPEHLAQVIERFMAALTASGATQGI